MKYLGAVFVFFFGMVLHWWWSTYFTVWGMAPHLLLILTAAISASSGPIAGQCYGFMWGLFLDVIGVHLFGSNALVLTLVGYLVGSIRRQMDVSSPLSQTMLVAAVTLGYLFSLAGLGLGFEHQAYFAGWGNAFFLPLLNALAAPFVFPVVQSVLGDL
ncbi:MAG: rod shape-determining protein MreD [Elusimicrobia bacterium]|nr:rod shape-determining protein MreD [Elusimicrobiota bacterium]